MMKHGLSRLFVVAVAGAAGFLSLLASADAQVVYAQPSQFEPFFAPRDETQGTSPSFEIYPDAYGAAPAVRVVARCQYPNGWNVTDFSRDVNGIPAGVDHACPAVGQGGRVRTRY